MSYAKAQAKFVLPDAVGPSMVMSLLIAVKFNYKMASIKLLVNFNDFS